MERSVARTTPEGSARRAARVAQVGARYGFGYVFGRRLLPGGRARNVGGRVGTRLRLALEELGPNFVELGHAFAARGDVLPPEVTAELGRASAPPVPVPFREVRGLVERELGNSLERLFVSLEEEPARVGAFTQSHRAVLPGGRAALMVVNRPGVRRDLLAMRPVADVMRRRVRGLPLDPVEGVGAFSAGVGQRRDMYFAAQIARRLAGLEGFGLRAPDVYRRYSTERCVTFEAPGEWAPLVGEGLGEASGELVRLGLLEGIFLADVAPERFVRGADGEAWLLDPTEVFALDPERVRGLAEAWAGVRRGDVDAVVRALPMVGAQMPSDARVLQRELRDTLGSLGGPLWREHSLAEVRGRGMEALRRGGVVLPDEVARLFASLVAAEELGRGASRSASRGASGTEEPAMATAAGAAEEAIERYRDPTRVVGRTVGRLAQGDTFAEYPRQIHNLLNELKDGEVEVVFRHRGIDELIGKVDILANRLVFALLISALLVGSAMLGIFSETGARFLGVSVFAVIGFALATVLALALLVGIIRSGRL